jgi:outer membrane protein OmpA-like peptidoglycan-associated protein
VTGKTKYTKFEPGDKVLFETDFRECPVGEFPEGFDGFEGALECVKYDDRIWVAPSTDGDAKLFKKADLGRGDFSIEFDALIYQDIGGAVGPELAVELYRKKHGRWDGERLPYNVSFKGYYHKCAIQMERVGRVAEFKKCDKKTRHVAIQVRRGQIRVYMDGKRQISVPFTLKENESVGGFKLLWIHDTNAYGLLVSNLKVAKYTKKEAKPTPEKLGIGVKKTKEGMKLTMPEKVLFDFNRFILKPEAKEALAVVGDIIRENPAKKLIVTGYTDNVGSDAYNLKLSLQRAQSVADYLIYCEKVDPKLFEIEGRGKADPIADNATEAGRAKNRRVEIRIVK